MNKPIAKTPPKTDAGRYFYSIATMLLLGMVVVGFQLFYFHSRMYPGRPLTPPIKTLIITHSVAMSLWMLLAIGQPWLIAGGHRRLHMTLGKVAAVIAACLVVLGGKLAVAAAKVAPPGLMYGPFTPKQFMAVPIGVITLFALFVIAGVAWRKRPDIHKPLMFLASLAAVAAAIARIDFLNHLYAGTLWQKLFGDFFFTVVAGGIFFGAKCLVFRKFDRWFAMGYVLLALWYLLIVRLMPTPWWDGVASFLLR